MKRKFFAGRRLRLRLAALAAFALLFQQFAFAAHFCAVSGSAAGSDCMGMSAADMALMHGDAAALCAHHCASAAVTPSPDAHALDVPPLMLPVLPTATVVVVSVATAPSSLRNLPHPSPPLRDLFCSRQI
ncbi:MAG TPA: hypothetical protein VFF05_07210 [Rudaea sp.]|jgi:hypothetical protein|nr:hypothetical protein [Rudaea sp.]